MQTRLMGHYNGKWPINLVYVLKPLITVVTVPDETSFVLSLIVSLVVLEWHLSWVIFLNLYFYCSLWPVTSIIITLSGIVAHFTG